MMAVIYPSQLLEACRKDAFFVCSISAALRSITRNVSCICSSMSLEPVCSTWCCFVKRSTSSVRTTEMLVLNWLISVRTALRICSFGGRALGNSPSIEALLGSYGRSLRNLPYDQKWSRDHFKGFTKFSHRQNGWNSFLARSGRRASVLYFLLYHTPRNLDLYVPGNS